MNQIILEWEGDMKIGTWEIWAATADHGKYCWLGINKMISDWSCSSAEIGKLHYGSNQQVVTLELSGTEPGRNENLSLWWWWCNWSGCLRDQIDQSEHSPSAWGSGEVTPSWEIQSSYKVRGRDRVLGK